MTSRDFNASASADEAFFNAPQSFERSDPLTYSSPEKGLLQSLEISLSQHEICMTIPHGAKVNAPTLNLPGGLVVFGVLRGDVRCAKGSLIVASGGYFEGSADAENFICEGEVGSPVDASGKVSARTVSSIVARGKVVGEPGQKVGGVAAFSQSAKVTARVSARSFQVPRGASLGRALLQTIS